MHRDNEEEFCDDPPLLFPDWEWPNIEILDQYLSVSHFAGGYGCTQTGSNLKSTRVDSSGENEHEKHKDHEHEKFVRSSKINWEVPCKHRLFSQVKYNRQKLHSGLEAECNMYKKCVLAKQSNISNLIFHIMYKHK